MFKNRVKISLCLIIPALLLLSLGAAPLIPAETAAAAAKGRLYLVGLGSGDLDNMTIRAQKTIAGADIVFAMQYVFKKYGELLKGKELHQAGHGLFMPRKGSKPKGKMIRQGRSEADYKALEDKTRRIIRQGVAAGKTVAVLAGGDPLLYSPHSAYLREFADLNPEVVPGLSCFNAANAALKKGPNMGRRSHSVILTSGMGMQPWYRGKDSVGKLAQSQSTMVFFTMHMNLADLVAQLKKSYPGGTPIAIVCHAGYRDREKVHTATLDTIMDSLKGQKLPFEHLVYVGDFLK